MVAIRRVVVGGAINTDLVARTPRYPEQGETVTGSDFAVYGGGKGANQAVAAARSGGRVSMVGGVGRDTFGHDRVADLNVEGIDTATVVVCPDYASGVALIAVEAAGDNRIIYVPGATLAVRPEAVLAALGDAPIGVLLLTLELDHSVIAALIDRARSEGARVLLNATPEPLAAQAFLNRVDLLIVNETEAAELRGGGPELDEPADWEQVARDLIRQGPGAVVITLGGAGALVVEGDRVDRVPAHRVDVVDTTGAGDTVCGSVAAALARGASLRDAVRLGVVAGSLACTVAGAQPSIPTLAAIERAIASS